MPAVKKLVIEEGMGEPIIDNSLKSHANDPFFLKKNAKAKEAVSKLKFPEHLKKHTT